MSKEVYLHVFFSEPLDMLVVSAETIQGVGKMLKERPHECLVWSPTSALLPLIFSIQEVSTQTIQSLRLLKPVLSSVTERKNDTISEIVFKAKLISVTASREITSVLILLGSVERGGGKHKSKFCKEALWYSFFCLFLENILQPWALHSCFLVCVLDLFCLSHA